MKKYSITALLCAMVLGGLAITFIGPFKQTTASNGVPPAIDLARGAALYAENCAACHGANLEGEAEWRSPDADGILPAPPHDDSGHTWHHTDELLFTYVWLGGEETQRRMGISDPKSAMPGFRDSLTEADVVHVLNFIKSRWSERSRTYQQKITRQSQSGG